MNKTQSNMRTGGLVFNSLSPQPPPPNLAIIESSRSGAGYTGVNIQKKDCVFGEMGWGARGEDK